VACDASEYLRHVHVRTTAHGGDCRAMRQYPFVVTQKLSSHEPPGGMLCKSL